jgi:hypothetical protein
VWAPNVTSCVGVVLGTSYSLNLKGDFYIDYMTI